MYVQDCITLYENTWLHILPIQIPSCLLKNIYQEVICENIIEIYGH